MRTGSDVARGTTFLALLAGLAAGVSPSTLSGQAAADGENGWFTWWSAGLTAASLFAYDEVARQAAGSRSRSSGELAGFGRWYGDWKRSAPFLLAGTLAVGAAADGVRGIEKGIAITAGTLAGSLGIQGLKEVTGRSRPNEGSGPFRFDPFRSADSSLPSGHAAFAFSFAAAVDAVTEGWLPATLAYGAAGITGLSRIADDKHWLSDVVIGAVAGTLISRTVATAVERGLRPDAPRAGSGDVVPARGDPGHTAHPHRAGSSADPGPPWRRLRVVAAPPILALQLRF